MSADSTAVKQKTHSLATRVLSEPSPGYFAFVMATGIVSTALYAVEYTVSSFILLIIGTLGYFVLWALYIVRFILFRDRVVRDVRDASVSFSYFTLVAGTGVLAVRFYQEQWFLAAHSFLIVAASLWLLLGYVLPWVIFMTGKRASILGKTNGSWFIAAVASQSLAISLAQIQPFIDTGTEWISIFAVLSWSVGVALYIGTAIFVVLRIIFTGITPEEFRPPYWIAMGALAIAVVAGTSIVNMEPAPIINATKTLIGGTVVIFWSFCVWLIPLLIGAGVWRHVLHKIPLTYSSDLWSMVFPIGMFAVASINIGRVSNLPAAEIVGNYSVYIAGIVWMVVCIALIGRIGSLLRSSFSA